MLGACSEVLEGLQDGFKLVWLMIVIHQSSVISSIEHDV